MTTDFAAVLLLTILTLAVFSVDIIEQRRKYVDELKSMHADGQE